MVIKTEIKGVELTLTTAEEIFSPNGVDRGTLAMLSRVELMPEDLVLDLGCGYGVVGILVAKLIGAERVVMVDVEPLAVKLAKWNAAANGVPDVQIFVSNGLAEVKVKEFSLILSNPPYHEDFSVPKRFIEDGFFKLRLGGRMVMVVKRLEWYKNKLTSIFGGVKVEEIDGYYVLTAEKRAVVPPKKPTMTVNKKHQKRQELSGVLKKGRLKI